MQRVQPLWTSNAGRQRLGRLALLAGLLTAAWAVPAARSLPAVAQETPFDPAAFAVTLEPVAEGFSQPLQVVDPGDGSGRLFVVEQTGAVRIVTDDGRVRDGAFLDLSAAVSTGYEQGLLGLAFHPEYADNGRLFVDYTDQEGDTVVAEYRVASGDPNRVDPESRRVLLTVDQPYPNHNGGLVLFGPDGYLYVGLGDGGSGGDPEDNGQNPRTLLGSILRLDVDRADGDRPYAIPDDNPFVGDGEARPEIWVYGLRNPWRFSFDRETGDLWIGDVGQNRFEEIDYLPAGEQAGANLGWNIMEGDACFEATECDRTGLAMPVFVYNQDFGCSVAGGYVYRGEAFPALRGVYLFADYCSGLLWGLGRGADGTWVASDPIETNRSISSFGEDADGELYVVDLGGGVYRVTAPE